MRVRWGSTLTPRSRIVTLAFRFGRWRCLRPSVREQGVDLAGGVSGDSDQHVAKIFPRVDIVPFAGADQRIKYCGAAAAVFAADKQIIFAAQRDRAQRVLADIIVYLQRAVFDEA